MQQLTLDKLENLKQILKKMENVAIAFSGGVDSTFLIKVAKDVLGDKILAVTATSPTYPEFEIKDAKIFTEQNGIRHTIFKSEELKNENFRKNPLNRCYLCKKGLFSLIKKIAEKKNIKYVLDATNFDDMNDYRPGIKALEELGIISPLKDVKLTKKEIRALSKEMILKQMKKVIDIVSNHKHENINLPNHSFVEKFNRKNSAFKLHEILNEIYSNS